MTHALVLPSVPLEVVHVQAPVQARDCQLQSLAPFSEATMAAIEDQRHSMLPGSVLLILLTVSLHVDDLFRASSSDAIDCRLVQLNNESGGHCVVPGNLTSVR